MGSISTKKSASKRVKKPTKAAVNSNVVSKQIAKSIGSQRELSKPAHVNHVTSAQLLHADTGAQQCKNCHVPRKSRKRVFSDKAWKALSYWNEVEESILDKPICEPCYNELREVLIDRSDELDMAYADYLKSIKAASKLAS